jgi:hypothetical protein
MRWVVADDSRIHAGHASVCSFEHVCLAWRGSGRQGMLNTATISLDLIYVKQSDSSNVMTVLSRCWRQ